MAATVMPPSSRQKHNRFVILSEGRNGSSYVVSCLNSHPDILCYPEILANQTWPKQRAMLKALVQGTSVARYNPWALNSRYFHTTHPERRQACTAGFKVKLNQVARIENFFNFIHNHSFKLLYLKRHNIVKSVISEHNEERLKKKYGPGTSNAERHSQTQSAACISQEMFVARLHSRLIREAAHELFYDTCQIPKKTIYYEDLLEDPVTFFFLLLNFLNVTQMSLRGNFLKTTPDNLRQAIDNYEDIKRLTKDTSFEKYFQD